jgi:hypothetical protein
VKILADIKSTTVATIPEKVNSYVLVRDPQTQWCKSGYFVIFNNSLKIGINSLSTANGSIDARLTDVKSGKEIEASHLLKIGESYQLDIDDLQYHITLNYIGAAGRNPFTKAAYMTVATYTKK